MAKAKLPLTGVGMDPLSVLGGLSSFAGSPAGPSMADGQQSSTNTMSASFAVGQGAGAGAASGMPPLAGYMPYALAFLAVLMLLRAVRK